MYSIKVSEQSSQAAFPGFLGMKFLGVLLIQMFVHVKVPFAFDQVPRTVCQ